MINRHRKALDVVEREESWIHQESWDNTYLWRRFQRSYICHEIQFHLSLSIKRFSWSLGYLVLQSRGLISEINTLVDKSNGLIGNFVVALMKWVCHTSTTSSDSDTNRATGILLQHSQVFTILVRDFTIFYVSATQLQKPLGDWGLPDRTSGMLGIWARGLRPRPGPLPGFISLRVSNSRRLQVLVSLSRDYRTLWNKADFGVTPSHSFSKIRQTSCRFNSTQSSSEQNGTSRNTPKLARFFPAPIFGKTPQNVSYLRKIFALAKPERKPLLIAIGLLLISSAVSMSIPFTIGKLIDFFSSTNPVRTVSWHILLCAEISYSKYHSIFLFGMPQASFYSSSLWEQLRMLVVQCWWDYQVRFETDPESL